MATQNIELTKQTLAEAPVNDQAAPVQAQTDTSAGDIGQSEPVPELIAPDLIASEETQSIADINNIADAAQLPATDETVLLQPEAVREIVEDTTNSLPNIEAQSLEVMEAASVASPIMKASAQTIEVVDELSPAPAAVQMLAVDAVIPAVANRLSPPMPPLGIEPESVVMEPLVQSMTPVQADMSENLGQFAPALPPITPAAQIPFGQHQQAATSMPDLQATPAIPHMPNPAQYAGQDGQSVRPPMQPPNPFPAQPDAVMATPLAAESQVPQPPSMVPQRLRPEWMNRNHLREKSP